MSNRKIKQFAGDAPLPVSYEGDKLLFLPRPSCFWKTNTKYKATKRI